MAVADRRPEHRGRDGATAADALAIGCAQAFALMPGVSRNGATLTAARWRGFRRADSNIISRQIALPVIIGAAGLKGARLAKRGVPPDVARGMAAGSAAAFVSTLGSLRLIAMLERSRSLLPTRPTGPRWRRLLLRRCDGARAPLPCRPDFGPGSAPDDSAPGDARAGLLCGGGVTLPQRALRSPGLSLRWVPSIPAGAALCPAIGALRGRSGA